MDLLIEQVDTQSVETSILTEANKEKKYIIRGPFMEANQENRNKRIYPHEVLAPELETYQQVIKENRAVGELNHPQCFSSSAKILTKNSWKFIKDIEDDEEVYSLNTNTGSVELESINKKIDEHYTGNMLSFVNRNINTLVTPSHRFLLQNRKGGFEYVTAQEIYNDRTKYSHHSLVKKGNVLDVDSVEYFNFGKAEEYAKTLSGVNTPKRKIYNKDLKIKSDVWMKFLGFYLAEGHCGKDDNKISIYQKKPSIVKEFQELISQFPEDISWHEYINDNDCYTWSFSDKRISDILSPLGICYDKYIPIEYKNQNTNLLGLLLEWFIKGDGRNQLNNGYITQNLFSTSRQLVYDLHEILIRIGGCGNIQEIIPNGEDYMFAGHLIKIENKHTLYQLHLSRTNSISLDKRFLNISEVKFDGRVYCVETNNSNFFVMDNNKMFVSGNSMEIGIENIAMKIDKLAWSDKNTVFGEAKILSTPKGMIVRNLMDEGIKFGVSSRGAGTLKEGVVQNDYKFVAVDLVWEPSARSAMVENIMEAKTEWVLENGILTEKQLEIVNQDLSKKADPEAIQEAFLKIMNFTTKKFMNELN